MVGLIVGAGSAVVTGAAIVIGAVKCRRKSKKNQDEFKATMEKAMKELSKTEETLKQLKMMEAELLKNNETKMATVTELLDKTNLENKELIKVEVI